MLMVLRSRALAVAALIVSAACTVQDTNIPDLAGPSDFALSLTVTATPDSIGQDGFSQASIVVSARGPNGAPVAGVPIRLDLGVGGTFVDFGQLNTKSIVTNADGRATAIYTAPPPSSAAGTAGPFQVVTVYATPSGSNYQTAATYSADIRLNTPGVILPPAGAPTASFTFSPAAPDITTEVFFDASTSEPGSGASRIVSYEWSFGDGKTESGVQADHVFELPGAYTVTLTVTNDRGIPAQTSRSITVGAGDEPTAAFVFSPTNPAHGQTVVFDASMSATTPGQQIVSYRWVFGDSGTPVTTSSRTYTKSGGYTVDGTYSVSLTITDSAGRVAVATQTVIVGPIPEEPDEEEP
ncbi:MAG: PKD domain-containing protein [Vicinamibacterales bacterium]